MEGVENEADNTFDPLELGRLAVSFDYLLYKIDGRVSDLAESTRLAVAAHAEFADETVRSLDISELIRRLDDLLKRARAVEAEMLKIQQWERFIEDFESRLDVLESKFHP